MNWITLLTSVKKMEAAYFSETSATLISSVFSDISLFSLLIVSWLFRGICYPHLQGWRISQARNQHEAGRKKSFTYFLTQKLEAKCSFEMLVDLQQTNGVMSQKMDFFITATVRISNPISAALPTTTRCKDPKADSTWIMNLCVSSF
jgi:hypothetical protein